jgi:group II intron reverse transcriptase/maturase
MEQEPLMGNTAKTPRFGEVLTKQQRIAELAQQCPEQALTSIHHFLDEEWMHVAYEWTRRDGAAGIDGQTAQDYERNLAENLRHLLQRIQSGSYVAPAVRRVHIPKSKGKTRPIGIPTIEDKIAQRAILMALEPIFESEFSDASYGFRPGRSPHQALKALRDDVMERGGRWVIDADIKSYFDTIDHCMLRKCVRRRVTDGVIVRMIDKWLKAGVMEDGEWRRTTRGTPQGGVISPLLANVYLHECLDQWFYHSVQPRMKARCSLVRFADDFVMVFEDFLDCVRVLDVLPKRMARYGLELHAEKTRMIDFRFKRPTRYKHPRCQSTTFNFLGFTHFWTRSRQGKAVVRQQTAKDRLAKALSRIQQWCKQHRHKPMKEQHDALSRRMRGHYGYYGITGNGTKLRWYAHQTEQIWRYWLSRRSRKSRINWKGFRAMLDRYSLPRPTIVHRYDLRSVSEPCS